jgi:hypothetical protein
MLGEVADGHQSEKDVAKDPLPSLGDVAIPGEKDDALEQVEESVLSRRRGS